MFIADRMSKIDSSGIRKVFNLAAQMKDPVNLSIGQPDFEVPEEIKEAAIRAVMDNKNSYTLTQGIGEMRQFCEQTYFDRYKYKAPASIITSGVSGGLLLALMATVNPGDEVLIPDPYFVMYKHLVNLLGGVPVYYNTYPDFKVHAADIQAKITPKTKILMINSPANPTGAVLGEDDLKAVAQVAKENGLLVFADEIYEEFCFDGSYRSICEFMSDNLLVFNGFSKSASVTGWRIGYALGDQNIINEMIKLQQYSFVCTPSFAQYALLTYSKIDREKIKAAYREKRDIVYNGLKGKFKTMKPGGAFYIFPQIPEKYATATEFVEKAIANKVLVIPGNVFSEKDTHFRLSFAAPNETLKRGVDILNSLA